MGPAVELRQVTKIHAGAWGQRPLRALTDLSLTAGPGEIVGLMGPNGSGKSTALKIMAGLSTPTAGTCFIQGQAAGSTAARAAIGYLPESPAFPEYLSGAEVVRYYAGLSGQTGAVAIAATARVLRLTGLEAAADRPARHYTKGMRQRLGLAQALVHGPAVLLLDEPTAGVDPEGTADLLALFAALRTAGCTIVLSSHLLEEVAAACDRIVILAAGRQVYAGTPDTGVGDWEHFATEPLTSVHREELAAWLQARGHTLQRQTRRGRGLVETYRQRTVGVRREGPAR